MFLIQNRKVCLYCRVSTDNQQGGLESQIRALKDWCVRNQVQEYELFTDEGISGAKENRPALNRLMSMVEKKEVEQVIVFSFSRFARSTSHLLIGLKTFKECDTRFISITESIDTNSPLGVALYTLTGQSIPLIRGIEYRVSVVIDPDYVGPLKFTPFPQRAEDYY